MDNDDFGFGGYEERQTGNAPNNQQQNYGQQSGGWNGGQGNQQRNNYQNNGSGSYQGNRNFGNNGNRGNWNGGQGGNRGNWKNRQEDTSPDLYKPYTLICNGDGNQAITEAAVRIAKRLEEDGYTIRIRGMDNVDEVVEKEIRKKEVHLPWKGFNQKESPFTFTTEKAKIVAKKHHPTYDGLKPVIQTFLATNVRCLTGKNINTPSLFFVCYSEDGCESFKNKTSRTGNVGHAISVAGELRIPIFNLGNPEAEKSLYRFLGFEV